MHSSMIGKVEKAMRYAHEPDRIKIRRLELEFQGDNGSHQVSLDADSWKCTCHLFESWGSCVHTLAVQKILGAMLSEKAQETTLYSATSKVAASA